MGVSEMRSSVVLSSFERVSASENFASCHNVKSLLTQLHSKMSTSFTKPSHRSKLQAMPTTTTNSEEYADKAEQYLRQAQEVGSRTSGRKSRCCISVGEGSVCNINSNVDVEPSQQQNQCIMTYPSASELQTKHEIKLTLQAAEYFRIAGEQHWFDSAKTYGQAAALTAEAMKDPRLAAELYTEAAIVTEKVDTDFANEYYRKFKLCVSFCQA